MPIVTKFVRVVTHYEKVSPLKSRDLVIFIFSYESFWFRAQPPKLSQTSTWVCVDRITRIIAWILLVHPIWDIEEFGAKKYFTEFKQLKEFSYLLL